MPSTGWMPAADNRSPAATSLLLLVLPCTVVGVPCYGTKNRLVLQLPSAHQSTLLRGTFRFILGRNGGLD
jgi:hypothetical protein